MQHTMLIPEIHEFSMLVKMRQRARLLDALFAFISKFSIQANIHFLNRLVILNTTICDKAKL